MAKNNARDDGLCIVGGESGGKVRLSKEGRRVLGVNKKVVKEAKFWDRVVDKKCR